MSLRLAVPSKGRLMEKCFEWFAARKIILERSGDAREYSGQIRGVDGLDLQFLSASEIPYALAKGQVHFGVTGRDLVHENLAQWNNQLSELAALGFGYADLVVAVPEEWVDVERLEDLDAVAAAFRAHHGFRLRIATKYHRLVRGKMHEAGVADYQLVHSHGATEGAIRAEAAEAIADITSSGETLRANRLKILEDGLILASEAVLWQSHNASLDFQEKKSLDVFMQRLREASPIV